MTFDQIDKMLEENVQLGIMQNPSRDLAETKYKIVMHLAERWGLEAFRQKVTPEAYCAKKFSEYATCRDWTEVTKVVLTAFVIREHKMLQDFFHG